MSHYIVCQRKRNTPRVDVRICETKCPFKEGCPEYMAYHNTMIQDKSVNQGEGKPSQGLRAA